MLWSKQANLCKIWHWAPPYSWNGLILVSWAGVSCETGSQRGSFQQIEYSAKSPPWKCSSCLYYNQNSILLSCYWSVFHHNFYFYWENPHESNIKLNISVESKSDSAVQYHYYIVIIKHCVSQSFKRVSYLICVDLAMFWFWYHLDVLLMPFDLWNGKFFHRHSCFPQCEIKHLLSSRNLNLRLKTAENDDRSALIQISGSQPVQPDIRTQISEHV